MPYEDKKAVPQRRPHAVTLDERSHLTVTGVDEVVRFDDTEVSMRTSRGMLMVVWKNQLMNSMKNFWNLVVFLEPEIK